MSFAAGIRLIVIGLVGVTAGLVGLVVYWGGGAILDEQAFEALSAQLRGGEATLTLAVDGMRRDAVQLSELPGAAAVVREVGDGGREQSARDRLAGVFRATLVGRPEYVQARLIGGDGVELVRVDRGPAGPVRVAREDLQDKSGRDYVRDALALPVGRDYLSEITLNREHGEIEKPYRGMLRLARAVAGDDGAPVALVVINVDFQAVLRRLFPEVAGRRIFVASERGDFLLHPDPDKIFGFELGFDWRILDEFPELAENPSTAMPEVSSESARADGSRALVGFRRVALGSGRVLSFGVEVSRSAIVSSRTAIRGRAMALTFALLLLALLAAYLFSARLTRPLADIAEAADRIAGGDEDAPLPTEARNEAGTVARALRGMLESLREKEANLLDTGERLAEANRDLAHFTHVASHDLREPARRVVGLADLIVLQEAEGLSEDARDLLARAQAEAQGMLSQISDLRVLVGVGSGEILRRPIELDALVRDVLSEFDDELRRRRVELRVADLPTLDVYPTLVATLIRNLVANALQHVKDDGFALVFSVDAPGPPVVLAVENTGSTIGVERRAEIFQPYHAHDRGGGVGLPICRRIVERHSGRIRVESGPDHVRFLFTLTPEPE